MSKITPEELDSFTIGEGLQDIPAFNDDQYDDELAIMAAQIHSPQAPREILLERLTPQQITEIKKIERTDRKSPVSPYAKNLEQARVKYLSDLEKQADGKASPKIVEDEFVKNIKKVLENAKKGAKESKKGGKRRKTKKKRKSRKRKTKKRRRRKKRKRKTKRRRR